MRLFRWTQGDATALEGLLVAGAALIILVGLGPLLLGAAGLDIGGPVLDQPVAVPVTVDQPVETSGPPTARLRGPTTMQLTMTDLGSGDRLLYLVAGSLPPLLAVAVVLLLLRVVRTLRRGGPFVTGNARRLMVVALLIGVGGTVVQALSQLLTNILVVRSAAADLVVESFEISFLPIVVGLLVAFLSEVFRQGTLLRDDVEGLV